MRERLGFVSGGFERPAGALGLFRRFGSDRSGSYLIVAGLTMPVLIGTVGLGSEVGVWYYTHQRMQSAADSAAISAATAYYVQGNATGLATQAKAATAAYGFVAGSNDVTVTVNRPPTSGTHTSTAGAVEVIVSRPQTRLFSALFSTNQLTVSARAVAIATGGLGCVLSLNATASGAVTVQGTSSVSLAGCSLMDNSNSSSALTVNGSAALSALSVNVVGGISGSSSITTVQGSTTGAAAATDPYAGVSYPTPSSHCDYNNAQSGPTLSPGVYCGGNGGISLGSGDTVTMNPGIYYMAGTSLTVNGGASLSGTGVTIVFTADSNGHYATNIVNINGGATVNLTAPTTGDTAGIVLFGDRNMPVSNSANFKFEGGASQQFHGALYLPKGNVSFAGGSGTGQACTQLVADQIKFTGNSNFAINCSGSGTKPLGSGLAQLVE